jgi:ankyrin repeat protein
LSDLLQALYRGEDEQVEKLLAVEPELDVIRRELGLACFFGHVDAARLLLERGADVNALSTNENVQTAAIHAAAAAAGDETTRYGLVKLALEHGADPNLPQGGGFRAIDAARQNGDARVEQLLLEHGAEG